MALSEIGDWNELDRFSKSKKSPIGYEVRRFTGKRLLLQWFGKR